MRRHAASLPLALLPLALLVGGCGMTEPRLPEAQPGIPAEWALPPVTPEAAETVAGERTSASAVETPVAEIGWREFFSSPELEQLIVNLPIFQAGRLRGNLDASEAERDIALAEYERSIQAAFREVADALALTRTLAEQRASRETLLAAAENADDLSKRRYEAGADSYLVLLDAQRTLYAAQQALITTLLAQQVNRVTLYKALGGGWHES